MRVIKQYKTFNNETGEIRIDCKVIETYNTFKVIQNDEEIYISNYFDEVVDYYKMLKQMDEYISKKLKWYEVYEIL